MKELAYIDGTFIDLKEYAVQLENRGYQLGDGVYETLRVYDGVCFGVKKHLERYRNSMRALNIPITDTDEELYNLFNEMIQKTEIKDGLIYFQLSRGTAQRSLQSPYPSLPHLNVIIRDTPVKTVFVSHWSRISAGSAAILTHLTCLEMLSQWIRP